MRQALIFLGVGLTAGFAMALWLDREPIPDSSLAGGSGVPAGIRADDLAARLRNVEAALAAESERRAALEATLDTLSATLLELAATAPAQTRQDRATSEDLDVARDDAGAAAEFAARRAARSERDSPEYRQQRLMDAGFAPDQAQWIIEREGQMRMGMLNEQYAATREGKAFNPLESQLAAQTKLREELGDAAYERYLQATGRPTSVAVRQVLESSPGQAAGLQAGDEILGYAGERVFNLVELNQLTLAGQPGESVAVDILRDGQPLQIYVPRGPVGITGGGRGFRFGPQPIP